MGKQEIAIPVGIKIANNKQFVHYATNFVALSLSSRSKCMRRIQWYSLQNVASFTFPISSLKMKGCSCYKCSLLKLNLPEFVSFSANAMEKNDAPKHKAHLNPLILPSSISTIACSRAHGAGCFLHTHEQLDFHFSFHSVQFRNRIIFHLIALNFSSQTTRSDAQHHTFIRWQNGGREKNTQKTHAHHIVV